MQDIPSYPMCSEFICNTGVAELIFSCGLKSFPVKTPFPAPSIEDVAKYSVQSGSFRFEALLCSQIHFKVNPNTPMSAVNNAALREKLIESVRQEYIEVSEVETQTK